MYGSIPSYSNWQLVPFHCYTKAEAVEPTTNAGLCIHMRPCIEVLLSVAMARAACFEKYVE